MYVYSMYIYMYMYLHICIGPPFRITVNTYSGTYIHTYIHTTNKLPSSRNAFRITSACSFVAPHGCQEYSELLDGSVEDVQST